MSKSVGEPADDTMECPVCENLHVDPENSHPTIGDILGPCANEWFNEALDDTGWSVGGGNG